MPRGEELREAVSSGNLAVYKACSDGRYPHMAPEDRRVWAEWLERGSLSFLSCFYDVRCGGPPSPGSSASVDTLLLYESLLRKRVDVVLQCVSGYVVVEVKPLGSLSALGQVLVYRELFAREWAKGVEVRGLVVCRKCDPDVRRVGEPLGVEFDALAGECW